ncbi:MAG TPA: LURP-one-related family protein [Thermoanaerobaculia bacterium]|nr:LURP-one-related family protein [Thermoanaerobaculia bacterium]
MTRYRMRQKLFAIGDDFTIEDEHGNPAYEVDGKAFSLRDRFELKDRQGNVVATIRGKLMSIREKMDILRGDDVAATVTKALFAPFRTKFDVKIAGGHDLDVDGSILDHEYTLRRDGDTIAQVSKQWFSFRDTYGIDVAAGEDDALVLAIAVAIDEMAHDDDK